MEHRSFGIQSNISSDGQVSLAIRRTQKAIEQQIKRELISGDGTLTIVDEISDKYETYGKLATDELIGHFYKFIDDVWLNNYPEADLEDVVYCIYLALARKGDRTISNIGLFCYNYAVGYVVMQDPPPELAVQLPDTEGISVEDMVELYTTYISQIFYEKSTKYKQELYLLEKQLQGMQGEISLFSGLTKLPQIHRESIEQESYFRALYRDMEINDSVAEFMYHTIPLDTHIRGIILRKGNTSWTRIINNEVDEYIDSYKKASEDSLTLYLYNGSPSLNARVIINYKLQMVSFKNKKTFNKQVIKAMLQKIGLRLDKLTEGGKEVFYYAYTDVPYANFTTVFGTMAVLSPTLNQVLAPRDFESYSNDTIKKKGFSTNQNRTSFRFLHRENQMVNITLKYGNPREFSTNVANAASNYLSKVYGSQFSSTTVTIVALKFDRSTSDSVITDIESTMNEFISYVLKNGREYQRILSAIIPPDIDYLQTAGKEKSIQDLSRAVPTLFDRNYTKFCSGPRLPTYVSQEDINRGVQGFPLESTDGVTHYFACTDSKYPILEFKPNPTASKVLHPFIPCCSPIPKSSGGDKIKGEDKTLEYCQIGELPRRLKDTLSDRLNYHGEELYRFGVGGPRSNAIRNAVRFAVAQYLEGPFTYDISTREYDDRFDDLLFAVEDKFQVNIYILDKDGNFVLPKYKKIPSFNPRIRKCVILYFLEKSVDYESSYDIIAPFPYNQAIPSTWIHEEDRNSVMYDLMISSNTVLVAKAGKIYLSPFDRVGLEDVFPNIRGVYVDSASKIRGVWIDVKGQNVTLEVPPFANHRISTLIPQIYPSSSEAVITVLGQPNRKQHIKYMDHNYVVYLYDYMGFPDGIKAVVSESSTESPVPWYKVLTIPLGNPESLSLKHLQVKNEASMLLKVIYWIWYPSILTIDLLSFLRTILSLTDKSPRYNFDQIEFILPSNDYETSQSRIEYVRNKLKLIDGSDIPNILVSDYLYRNIYYTLDYVRRSRVRSDKFVRLQDYVVLNEKYELPQTTDKFIEFRSEAELNSYKSYSNRNANTQIVAMNTDVLYNSKPPSYYFDGKTMMKVGYNYSKSIQVCSETEDKAKTVSVLPIASLE
jgi:hypothetical protein